MSKSRSASVSTEDVNRFSAQAEDWWNPSGGFRSLHELNPLRLAYIRDQAIAHFGRAAPAQELLRGIHALDVGCGGGLLAEPLTRMGAEVTGVDASGAAIVEARRHAAAMGLSICYRTGSVEEVAESPARFDLITAMEIVEHVADMDSFVRSLAALLKPDGVLILSTLNRTIKSFALGVVAAEYVLNWVPRGMHDWNKFVRPSELAQRLESRGLQVSDLTGAIFNPCSGQFEFRQGKVAVNYLMTAVKIQSAT